MIRQVLLATAFCLVAASGARAQVKLEYKYIEGRQSTVKSTTKAHQIIDLNGMSIETDTDQVVHSGSTIGKRAADGSLPISQKVDQIRFHLGAGGLMIDYDTADPTAKIELPQLAFLGDMLKAIVGQQYTVVLDAQNKAKDVEGLDKILENAKALSPEAQEALKERLTADRIKREFEKALGYLPSVLAREGEPWERTEADDIGGGQTLTFRRRYEYKGTVDRGGKKLDKIAITALDVKYDMDPNAKSPLKVTKSDLKLEKSTGEMLFDREEGVIVERKQLNQIKGSMDFKVGDKDLPGKLDLTLESSHEVQPKSTGK